MKGSPRSGKAVKSREGARTSSVKGCLSRRKTLVGEKLHEGAVVDIIVTTRVPEKWLFVDTETGDVYRHPRDKSYQLAGKVSGRIIAQITQG